MSRFFSMIKNIVTSIAGKCVIFFAIGLLLHTNFPGYKKVAENYLLEEDRFDLIEFDSSCGFFDPDLDKFFLTYIKVKAYDNHTDEPTEIYVGTTISGKVDVCLDFW